MYKLPGEMVKPEVLKVIPDLIKRREFGIIQKLVKEYRPDKIDVLNISVEKFREEMEGK